MPKATRYTGGSKKTTSSSGSSSSGGSSEFNISTPSGYGYSTPGGDISYPQTNVPSPTRNRRGGGGGGSVGGMSTPTGEVLVTPSGQVVGNALTPQQKSAVIDSRRNEGFTGTVEKRDQGQLQTRTFYNKGQEVFKEGREGRRFDSLSRDITERAEERPGRVTNFTVQRNRQGRITGVQETRELNRPVTEIVTQEDIPFTKAPTVDLVLGGASQVKLTNLAENRQQFSPLKRIKLAYKSVPGSPISVRGGIRAGFELTQIGVEKTGLDKFIPKIANQPVRTTYGEDLFIGGVFLGITTPTRTTLVKSVQPTKVFSIGQQNIDEIGNIQTDLVFQTEKGQRGLARGISRVIGNKKGRDIILTEVRGASVNRQINFPSAKEVVRTSKEFAGVDLSFVKNVNTKSGSSASISYDVGKTANVKGGSLKDLDKFVGASFGLETDIGTTFIGRSFSKRGDSISLGVIKRTTGNNGVTYIKGVSGSSLKKSLQQVQNAVSQSVVETPKVSVKPIPSLNINQQISSPVKQETSLKSVQKVTSVNLQIPKSNSVVRVSTKLVPVTRTKTRTSNKQLNLQQELNRTAQKTNQALRLNLNQSSAQRYAQSYKYRQQQKSKLQNRIPNVRIKIPSPKPKPFVPFKLPKQSFSSQRGGGFSVFLRRFGIFKPIAKGVSQREAFNIGKSVASKTLGATFKVEGYGANQPLKIPGFKTKKTKKGIFYIELPKYRLSKQSEIKEIQSFRKSKRRKK